MDTEEKVRRRVVAGIERAAKALIKAVREHQRRSQAWRTG